MDNWHWVSGCHLCNVMAGVPDYKDRKSLDASPTKTIDETLNPLP